jgi:menaquinol-cytochrome c reductase iron-sulfur subunit
MPVNHFNSENEDRQLTSRRRFFKIFIGTFAALGTAALGIPMVGSFIGDSMQLKKLHFALVTSVADIPLQHPVDLSYPDLKKDAYLMEMTTRNVWAIKQSSSKITIFSPICPHLGCRYNWHPKQHQFICPCHGSVFSITGKVLAGPAPRPLDTLPHKIEHDDLYVEWERFKLGIPQKVRI